MKIRIVVIISADAEWRAFCDIYPNIDCQSSPFGEWSAVDLDISGRNEPVLFFQGGWGKIAAASSTQYVIDRWQPELLVNIGTCGGFEGRINQGDIILADKTIVYDIVEQMGDFNAHINHYTTVLDLSRLDNQQYPQKVLQTLLVSADRDLLSDQILWLEEKFGAIAGDWESGAIAWVSQKNHIPLIICEV